MVHRCLAQKYQACASVHSNLHVNGNVMVSLSVMSKPDRAIVSPEFSASSTSPSTLPGPPGLPAPAEASAAPRLVRIQEVASELGLTTRSIRYYEEIGLLSPAARSDGAYRLYDASDVERLRFIKGLRDDAGFSLAEISQLLEDEAVRAEHREAFGQTLDRAERRALIADSLERADRQVGLLRAKIARLEAMTGTADERRTRLRKRLADLDAGGIGEVR
jgi:MerR family transcriptional regulator, repressor of the yfmOP operon